MKKLLPIMILMLLSFGPILETESKTCSCGDGSYIDEEYFHREDDANWGTTTHTWINTFGNGNMWVYVVVYDSGGNAVFSTGICKKAQE